MSAQRAASVSGGRVWPEGPKGLVAALRARSKLRGDTPFQSRRTPTDAHAGVRGRASAHISNCDFYVYVIQSSPLRLGNSGLSTYGIERPLRQWLLAMERNDRAPTRDRIEHSAMRTDAVAFDESESAQIRDHLICVQRLHASATTCRLRSMRRRSLRR